MPPVARSPDLDADSLSGKAIERPGREFIASLPDILHDNSELSLQ